MNWYSKIDYRIRVAVLFILCMCDMLSTYILLGRGADELNPLINLLVAHDILWFIAFKIFVTSVGCIAIHKSRNRISDILLNLSLIVYSIVVTWNIYLVVLSRNY